MKNNKGPTHASMGVLKELEKRYNSEREAGKEFPPPKPPHNSKVRVVAAYYVMMMTMMMMTMMMMMILLLLMVFLLLVLLLVACMTFIFSPFAPRRRFGGRLSTAVLARLVMTDCL